LIVFFLFIHIFYFEVSFTSLYPPPLSLHTRLFFLSFYYAWTLPFIFDIFSLLFRRHFRYSSTFPTLSCSNILWHSFLVFLSHLTFFLYEIYLILKKISVFYVWFPSVFNHTSFIIPSSYSFLFSLLSFLISFLS
jgi:hypothetical protein